MKGRTTEYRILHYWVEKQLGRPSECENCGDTEARRYEWSNISGKYRREPGDWVRLCVTCHRIIDNQYMKTHCVNGHEYTPDNTYMPPNHKTKECVTCRKERRNPKQRQLTLNEAMQKGSL